MRLTVIVTCVLAACGLTLAQAADPGIPATQPLAKASPDAENARKTYLTTAGQLRDDFLKKLTAEHDKYLKRLEALMVDATRKGNLEAALSIRVELAAEKGKSASQLAADVTSPPQRLEATPAPSGVYRVAWFFDSGSTELYTFVNGTCSVNRMTSALTRDTERWIVRWPNGMVDTFYVLGDVLFAESRKPGVPLEAGPSGFGRGEKLTTRRAG